MKFDIQKKKSSIIKVLGVGGGGSNAVSYMLNQGIYGVDFAICNTDIQSMELNHVEKKIQLGLNITEGMGAGSEPEIGRQACLESIEDLREFLSDNTRMLFITAGLGGGTGTGAAPIIAQLSKEMGILTVGIVTTPFTFEGAKRAKYGFDGLEEMKKYVDSIIVVSNDKLIEMYGTLKYRQAFAQADNVLATAAKGIAEIITIPGIVNVDFKDVCTVMKNSGVAIMGIGEASGENRAKNAVDAALNSPLLENGNIRGAMDILVNITCGEEELSLEEIGEINNFIQEEAGYGTNLVMGNCVDPNLGDKVSVTLIATGFNKEASKKTFKSSNETASGHNLNSLKVKDASFETLVNEEIRISLDDESLDMDILSHRLRTIDKLSSTQSELSTEPHFYEHIKMGFNDHSSKKGLNSDDRNKKQEFRNQIPKLSNNQVIYDLEREPSFKRRGVVLEDVMPIKDDSQQNRVFFSDTEEANFQDMNPRFKKSWED